MSDMRGLGSRTAAVVLALCTRINNHINQKGNVHDLVPADIGLERVPNYAPSTKTEAASAVNNTSLMTPKRTNDWAEENVYGPIGEAFRDAAARLP